VCKCVGVWVCLEEEDEAEDEEKRDYSRPKNIPNIHKRGGPTRIAKITHQGFSLLIKTF
jgi:hypothetical protein